MNVTEPAAADLDAICDRAAAAFRIQMCNEGKFNLDDEDEKFLAKLIRDTFVAAIEAKRT